MADPISFNKARKDRTRAEAKAKAAENRVRFGRSKAEKDLAAARVTKLSRELDARKRED